ncbi:hypothetical protein QBC35DRAFT_506237 [Podospora australis]|uniref:SMP-30/Gluconolactonase/LRE-like region domain-containing protein n=1 Tax=Podospora australis TaxID=1536484 RepID=A0AAN6WMZ1_9PEZI|nr:hypothetical protein QBC35DRAFT_506237 [Podospora australis]
MKPSLYFGILAATAFGVEAAAVTGRGGNGGGNTAIRNVFTFPPNHFIENIAVRSNSKLLITSMSVNQLWSIDPTVANPTATVIHTFSNSTGISGIAEITPDLFALVTGEWDLANTRAYLGTLQVWTVDFTKHPNPQVKFVTGIANSTIFNGVARHPTNPRLLLAADSAIGAVWRVDLMTGAYGVAFSSPLLTPTGTAPGTHLGINGLRSALPSHLYFTNSAQKFFGKVAVDWNGNQAGAIQVISNSTVAGADVVYDDIAVRRTGTGTVWIASHPDYAIGVSLANGSQQVIKNSTMLLNPTSAAFGRGSWKEEKTLYITNGGEFVGMDLVNEGVVAIDL